MELKECRWIDGISNDRGGRVFVLNRHRWTDIALFYDRWWGSSFQTNFFDKILASSITVGKLQEELFQAILRYIEKGSHFASIICQSGRRTPLSIEIDWEGKLCFHNFGWCLIEVSLCQETSFWPHQSVGECSCLCVQLQRKSSSRGKITSWVHPIIPSP